MRPLEPTHVLFLCLRALSIALGLHGVYLCRLLFAGATGLGVVEVETRRLALLGLLHLLVAGGLFLFPDRLAVRLMRKSPFNLTRVAVIVSGLVLTVGAVEQLVSSWPMAKLLTEERWLGFIPKDWSVSTHLTRLLLGVLVIFFSEHISNWLDPDWRKMRLQSRYQADDEV